MDTFDFYNPLKELFERLKLKIEIDSNFVFLLHRQYTFMVVFGMLACFNLYYIGLCGKVMACMSPTPSVGHDTFTVYCWAQGTFIVLEKLNLKVGVQVPHPGIGPLASFTETPVYQLAYSLIYPYFGFLLLAFKFPWWIWKNCFENGRLRCLLKEIDYGYTKTEPVSERKKLIVTYFVMNLHYHNGYAFRYIVCELLNLFNVFFQVWLTDYLLQGEFSTYGLEVLQLWQVDPPESRIDPMAKLFPKVTKCILNVVGPSGNVQGLDGLCIMSLNNMLEKIFVVLWFWYLILALCSCLGMVYRILTIYIRKLRYWLLCFNSKVERKKLELICSRCYYGDWYLIFSLKNILDNWLVDEILNDFADKLLELDG